MAGKRGRNWASDPANAARVKTNSDKGVAAIQNRSEFDKALHRYKARKYAGRKKQRESIRANEFTLMMEAFSPLEKGVTSGHSEEPPKCEGMSQTYPFFVPEALSARALWPWENNGQRKTMDA